jgi:hypothetical protein
MLDFDTKGLLIPDKNIRCTIDELKTHFVDAIPSDTRLENFEKYIHYSNELKQVLGLANIKQWINGSFVTNVKNPKDIDLITFIDFDIKEKFQNELKKFEAKGSNTVYGVDAYLLTVFPENHSKRFLFESDFAYWMHRFSKTRRDITGKKNPKGFLEIIY